ncbi:MAG: hypothetical protein WHU93_02165 [Arcobacteraceae bacterium]|jgi:hypothetical protein|nr:hypothetical protein [Arcobacteraceae bacterium]
MAFTVIDSKTESQSYGGFPVSEKVKTTLQLLNMGDGNIGLSYDSSFSGVKSGQVHGGPIAINGNEDKVVNQTPRIVVSISEFNKSKSYASMHVRIVVDIPVLGNKTIYNQTLGGHYEESTGWAVAMENIESIKNS